MSNNFFLIVTSSATDKKLENKLEIYKNLEIKLEIYKNLENKLEIYHYSKLENSDNHQVVLPPFT